MNDQAGEEKMQDGIRGFPSFPRPPRPFLN